ncbi:MAG: hypothetical protein OEZ48_02335 [Candidatus Bathyarchaeota archaeon]|nr:hypothetical protein [Candidatus Bathyarchaeota archaeon]MDH5686692.1 hypothetical protein [Candidatus Bathyarchaeota archaeon]
MKGNAKSLVGVLFLTLSFSIVAVSAFVYEQASQTVTQTIVNVATITLQDSALGSIDEGETKTYTNVTVASLGDAISITTTKAVYLHLSSDVDILSSDYTMYDIVVKFDTVPGGSSHTSGQTACTLTLASPSYSSINLDVAGSWTFNFEITTTASSVSSDQPTTVTITVSAESTS